VPVDVDDEEVVGTLNREEVIAIYGYYLNHQELIDGYRNNEPIPLENEQWKHKPVLWAPGHWAWFFAELEETMYLEGINLETPEVPAHKVVDTDTGTIEFEYDRKEAVAKWERDNQMEFPRDSGVIPPKEDQ